MGGRANGSAWLVRSYNFVDKDPEVDRFRTLWQKERIKEADLAVLAGLAPATVHNMFGGETRQPRHSTFAKMAGALGYKYELHRDDGKAPNYEREIPKAREQYKEHKKQLARRKRRAAKRGRNGH